MSASKSTHIVINENWSKVPIKSVPIKSAHALKHLKLAFEISPKGKEDFLAYVSNNISLISPTNTNVVVANFDVLFTSYGTDWFIDFFQRVVNPNSRLTSPMINS